MASLPQEIIFEILTWLPAKCLLRFRRVSKTWCVLISDSTFAKKHLNQAFQRDDVPVDLFLANFRNLFVFPNSCIPRSYIYSIQGNDDSFGAAVKIENPLDFIFHDSNSKLVGSCTEVQTPKFVGFCNGLVCFVKGNDLCFLNPSTREYKVLRFDNNLTSRNSLYGLGYDSSKDDYKLVQVVYNDISKRNSFGSYDVQVNVFSSLGVSHTVRLTVPCTILEEKEELGSYINGALHWIADSVTTRIMSFHIQKEMFGELLLPMAVNEFDIISIGALGGQLCLVNDRILMDVEVWVMRTYGASDSWSKLCVIRETILNVDGPLENNRPLCFSKNAEFLFRSYRSRTLLLFDPKHRTTTSSEICGISDCNITSKVLSYVPSLVRLNSGSYAATVTNDEEEQRRIIKRFRTYKLKRKSAMKGQL